MRDLEDEVRNLRLQLALLTESMALLLRWAKEAEKSGSIPTGTMEKAEKFIELGRLRDELALVKEALEALNEQTAPVLQLKLRRRVGVLQTDMYRLIEELEAQSGSEA
jgi:hypothetical protein